MIRVLLIKVTLLPLDKYKRFHPANLLSTFSKIGVHIVLSLNFAPKGRPKYFIGRVPCLSPRTFNNNSILWTTPTGTNFDLPQIYFLTWNNLKPNEHYTENRNLIKVGITKNKHVISKEEMGHHQRSSL